MTNARVTERQLVQLLRVVRTEQAGRKSLAALSALTYQVIRSTAVVNAWRAVEKFSREVEGIPVRAHSRHLVQPLMIRNELLHELAKPAVLIDFRQVIGLTGALSTVRRAPRKTKKAVVEDLDAVALRDIVTSRDPHHVDIVLNLLQYGPPADLREAVMSRRHGIQADPVARADTVSLAFDMSLNSLVESDRTWAYPVSLAQLLEYEIPGVMQGVADVAERLSELVTDPVTNESLASREDVAAVVADLFMVRDSNALADVLEHSLDFTLTTADGGLTATDATWAIDPSLLGNLAALLGDPEARASLRSAADTNRDAEKAQHVAVTAKLESLLQKYPGVPQRHRRAHNALINCGRARIAVPELPPQTMAALGADNGALPRRETLLTAANIGVKYADADSVKLRFCITDRYEVFAIDDDTFHAVVNHYGYPPNHEILGYNRPLTASGYIVIHRGRIVGCDDDTTMFPGKLGKDLPPAPKLLHALGFEVA
ncbi:MAG: hypothetical protein H7Z43_06945 [Clostridia bacterium]|nr:hypothetical protein [Deltaproteobacteria bacterium]